MDLFAEAELTVTETGQVSTSLNSETVFSINREETQKLLDQLDNSRNNPKEHCGSVLKAVPEKCGYQKANDKPVDAVLTGRYSGNVVIEKRFIEGVGNYPIPFVVMIPEQTRKNTVILYLDPNGKNVRNEHKYFYKSFLESGHIVVLCDLVNTGEVGPTEYQGDATINGISCNIWYMAVQNAVSIVGIRASDVNRLVDYLSQRFPDREVAGASRGDMNAVLLHASVMNPQIKARYFGVQPGTESFTVAEPTRTSNVSSPTRRRLVLYRAT